jgi:subtilisin
MADPNGNGPKPGKRQPSTPDAGKPAAAAGVANKADTNRAGDDAPIGTRRRRYLCAIRNSGGLAPMAADMLHNYLNEHLTKLEGVEVIKRLKPAGLGVLSAGTNPSTPEIIVAEMDVERGEALRLQAATNPNYVVEVDHLLKHFGEETAQIMRTQVEASLLPTQGSSVDIHLRVVGAGNRPLANATVIVYGTTFPAQGTTDRGGDVQLTVYGGPIESIRAIYVKPAADHWEQFVSRPSLNATGTTVIQLRPLAETFPNFPAQGFVGWGQRAMRLDAVAGTLTGRGVKIAIIDSGCDNAHPQLTHVQNGLDLTADPPSPATWNMDEISHGTHCAGIISGASRTVQGVRGFAPEAEVHALKVFPGGRFSNLIDALDQCITREIDVVNMSLGSDQPSELVTRKIQEAVEHGVALIVAAGNSGGPVQFPGSVPGVFAVSAVGQLNQFPGDTNHAQNVLPGGMGDIFPAKFSCFGPQVRVCGPGVAIVSSVPGGGYAAWDGTSMATPHVTGLAALVLAHHQSFQGQPKQRNAARVAQLFQILQAASKPCVVDVQRGGAGLPDAVAIFGQPAQSAERAPQRGPQPRAPATAESPQQPAGAPINLPEALRQLLLGVQQGRGYGFGPPYDQAGYYAPPQQMGWPPPQANWAGLIDQSVIQALALAQMRAAGLI